MEARLAEAGVSVERAHGLESGLEALSGREKPDVVIVDCALGPDATNRLAQAAREAGSGAASCCFRRSNGGPSGRRRSKDSTAGWSSQSGRVRCSSA